jgi:hypothetical protein
MRDLFVIITIILLVAFSFVTNSTEAQGACVMSYCKDQEPKRTYITNPHRQRIGDLYSPGTGRIQIRNNHRQIIGYIESDGSVTNTHRQKIGKVNGR